MEIELEFKTDIKDKTEILTKLIEVVKTAQQQGLELKEIEMEEGEED